MLNLLNLAVLSRIAVSAGKEIMRVYDSAANVLYKADTSPLTEADLAADAVIRQELERHFPGVFILSEESVSALDSNTNFFLVDPLDGTKEFIKRNGEFTVNIAWVENGVPILAVVYAPALDEVFFAGMGLGAWMQKGVSEPERLNVRPWSPPQPLRVIGSRSHGNRQLQQWLAGLRHPFVLNEAGSSLKFCRVAQGMADIHPRFAPTSQWDTAAAQCVLCEAGGDVVTMSGQRLCYGLDRTVLNPEFIAIGSKNICNYSPP